MKTATLTEHQEQVIVANYLRARRIRFYAVPNGGQRNAIVGAKLKAEGVQRGVPDLVITQRPPGMHGVVGLVIEMKRADGSPSDVTPEQREWLEHYEQQGHRAFVAFGHEKAIRFIEEYHGKA